MSDRDSSEGTGDGGTGAAPSEQTSGPTLPSDPPSAPPEMPTPPTGPAPVSAPAAKRSADERKELLARAIQTDVVQGGRVESQHDFQAVIVHGQRVNHVLHLLLALLTCGLWLIVWVVLAITRGEKRFLLVADDDGNVLRQKL